MTKSFTKYLFLLFSFTLCSTNLWAWTYAKTIVYSEPENGGYVYVSKDNNVPTTFDKTSDESKDDKSGFKNSFTFYRFYSENIGYRFKGWATSQNENKGDLSSSIIFTVTTNTALNYETKECYAIFARLTSDKKAISYNTTNVGQSAQQAITITHAHAGKVTASLSGTNAGDFSLSSATPIENSIKENTTDLIVTFTPTCNGTRTATLTLHSDNGLDDVVISLRGEGALNPQTLSWDNEPIDTNLKLGSTLSISATATSVLPVSYTSSNPSIIAVDGNMLTAKGVGTAIITAEQAGDCKYAPASITKEFIVNDKATPIFWLNNTPNLTEASLKVEESVIVHIENTDASLSFNYDTNIFSHTLTGDLLTITAYNAAADATFSLTQPETDDIREATCTFTFHISKHANHINWLFNGEQNITHTLNYNECINTSYSSDNKDIERTPITITQTSGTDIASYNEDANTICASYRNGTATWTISQPEDYKYLAAETTISVIVAPLSSIECDIINSTDVIEMENGETKGEFTWNGINAANILSFEAGKNMATAIGDFEVYAKIENNWKKIQTIKVGDLDGSWGNVSYKPFTYQLGSNVSGIRFKNAGDYSRYVRNIRITRNEHLTPSSTNLTISPVKLGNRDSVSFTLQWSTCADDIRIVSDNPHFTLSKDHIAASDGAGTDTIKVFYTSDIVENTATTITIYTPYQNLTLNVAGSTEKKSQTLTWADLWEQVEEPTISIGRRIQNAATSSVPGLLVTYTSSDPSVIAVEDDGITLKALKLGSATITAHQAGDEEWAAASIQKTFHVTEKQVQYIVWKQNLTRLYTTDNTIELTAQVFTEDANGELVFNNERTAHLTYTCADTDIATVSGNTLTIHATGTTALTASIAGNDAYEAAQSVMPVRVLEATAGCPDYFVQTDCTGEIEFFQANLNKIEKTYAIDRTTGIPGRLSFQYKGEKWALSYGGTIEVRESTDGGNTWSAPLTTVTPKIGEYQLTTVNLSREATHIRFTRPANGKGYHYIKDVEIEPAQFIESPYAAINFGTMQVGSTEQRTFTIFYSNIKSPLAISMQDAENEETTSSNAATPFVLSANSIGECGTGGTSEPVTLSFTPNDSQIGDFRTFVVIEDPVGKQVLRIPVEATIESNNHFTFTGGDNGSNEWGNSSNWSGGNTPTADDEVIVAADVIVTGDVSVAGLTINPGNTLTIKVEGHLTIGDNSSNDLTSYGNLVIENGGIVTLGNGTLHVKDLIINAATGTLQDEDAPLSENNDAVAASGQLIGQNIEYQNAYIDISFADYKKGNQWHTMTVPFLVDIHNGVFTTDYQPLTEGSDYLFIEYDGNVRATGKTGWKYIRSGELVPGTLYGLGGNGDIKTFRFKQTSGALFFNDTKTLTAYESASKENSGWNGVGNPTLCHGTTAFPVQVLNPTTYTFISYPAHAATFPVGAAFFIQTAENTQMQMQTNVPGKLIARTLASKIDNVCILFSNDNYSDKLYISASDEASDTYEVGKDLGKMSMTASPAVPQISAPLYSAGMCMVHLPLQNGEVMVPLTLYVPQPGQYMLSAQNNDNQVDVYLMQGNSPLWNLSAGDYNINLNKGNTQEYQILIRQKPQMPTGTQFVAEQPAMEKVLYQQRLYIIKDGAIYDSTGRLLH